MKFPRGFPSVFALGLLLGASGCGTAPTPAPRISLAAMPAEQQARAQSNARVFERVWQLVADKHYDAKLRGVDWKAAGLKHGPDAVAARDDHALYAALNAMIAPLDDSHTYAHTPRDVRERRTQQAPRLGLFSRRLEGRLVVHDVLPGSPAGLAGVKAGWIFVAVDGVPVGTRRAAPPADDATLTCDFLDETDRPVTLALHRQRVSTAPRRIVRVLPDGFVYLRFDEFNAKATRWLSSELEKHTAAPGVVIDLRHNTGGRAYSVEFGIGEFFDKAVPTGTSILRDGEKMTGNSWQLGSAKYRGKVAVLTDRPTASCAEILAAVLQEHARATIVGRKTAGAVLASWFYSLPDGGELQLSESDYLTPKGRRLEGEGVTPDVAVKAAFESIAGLRAGRDLDIEAALAVLKGEPPANAVSVGSGGP